MGQGEVSVQSLNLPSTDESPAWGKRILIIGGVLFLICIIGFFSQMGAFTKYFDPRLSGAIEISIDEPEIIELEGGCYKVWTLNEMEDVNLEIRNSNSTVIEDGGCGPSADGDWEPMGENQEEFIFVGEWVVKSGNYSLFATCIEGDIDCQIEGKVWMIKEGKILEDLMGETLLWGFFCGCMASLCLIPIGLTINVINSNKGSSSKVMIIQGQSGEILTAGEQIQPDENDSLEQVLDNNMMLDTDQIYKLVNSNSTEREKLVEGFKSEAAIKSVPDPFKGSASSPKLEPDIIPIEPNMLENKTKSDEIEKEGLEDSKPKQGAWQNWDEG
jgi:hypothetical protein